MTLGSGNRTAAISMQSLRRNMGDRPPRCPGNESALTPSLSRGYGIPPMMTELGVRRPLFTRGDAAAQA